MKNREFGKEVPQIFRLERAAFVRDKGSSENGKCVAADTSKMSGGHFRRGADERSELARRELTSPKIKVSPRYQYSLCIIASYKICTKFSKGNSIRISLATWIDKKKPRLLQSEVPLIFRKSGFLLEIPFKVDS
jgi:hypothetical protein